MGKKDSIPRQIQGLYLTSDLDKPIPNTFWAALEIYLKSVSDSRLACKVQTAARVWVAGAGGPKRKGDRVTDVEKRKIEGYLMECEFTKFWEPDPLTVLEIGFRRLQVGPRSRNTYRHAFKQFIVFCQQHSWDPREPKKTEYLRLQYPKGSGIKPSRRAGWQCADKIALTPRESPTHLNEEMKVFKEFCFEELDVSTNGYTEDFIRRYFGMLHREGMPLEDLSLTKIVPYVKSGQQLTLTEVASGQIFADNPVVKLAISEGRFFEALAVAKELCREQEAKVVQHVEALLNNFSKYTTCKSSGRIYELAWIIRIAKFVYRHEIRESGEDLIPLLCFLKKRRQRLVMRAKQEKPRVAYEDKSLARKQLLLLVYKLKKLAVQEKNCIGYLDLAPSTRALNMQTFLAVSFFSLLPPRRYRVLYELEVGRTIRRGLRVDKRFVVYDELTDQSQARWYYYLSAEDYKTGKHKGESWTPIPDWTFNDGTTL